MVIGSMRLAIPPLVRLCGAESLRPAPFIDPHVVTYERQHVFVKKPSRHGTAGLFSFEGRIGRSTLFWIWLGSALVVVIFPLPLLAFREQSTGSSNGQFSLVHWLVVLLLIPVSWAQLAAFAKRWHDLGKTGWLSLLAILPLINFAVLAYLLFAKGTGQSNEYGPPPGQVKSLPPNSPFQLSAIPSHASPTTSAASPRLQPTENLVWSEQAHLSSFPEGEALSRIAEELESKTMDKALWLKVMISTGGADERQQTINYTLLRLQKLRQAFDLLEKMWSRCMR